MYLHVWWLIFHQCCSVGTWWILLLATRAYNRHALRHELKMIWHVDFHGLNGKCLTKTDCSSILCHFEKPAICPKFCGTIEFRSLYSGHYIRVLWYDMAMCKVTKVCPDISSKDGKIARPFVGVGHWGASCGWWGGWIVISGQRDTGPVDRLWSVWTIRTLLCACSNTSCMSFLIRFWPAFLNCVPPTVPEVTGFLFEVGALWVTPSLADPAAQRSPYTLRYCTSIDGCTGLVRCLWWSLFLDLLFSWFPVFVEVRSWIRGLWTTL